MADNSSDVLGPLFYSGRVNTSDLVDTGYKIGDNTLDENQTVVEATRRSIVIPGIAADQEYTIEITAYRRVDPDVAPGGIVRAAPVVAPSSPYRGVEIVKLGEDVMVGVVKANEIKPLIDAAKTEGTNARAEAVQVRTDLVPTITAAKAEGTTARSEAAQVRTDLVPTIAAAKAEGTAARNEAATVASDLAGEVTRAKGAEGTLSTRITQAQGTADGAQTAITTEQTTRATADTALANRATILEAANRLAPSLTVDAVSGLDQWTSSRPLSPDSSAILDAFSAAIVTDADFGQAIEWRPTSAGSNIGPKAVIRVAPGRVYEVRARFKVSTLPSDGVVTWNHFFNCFDANLTSLGGVNGNPSTTVSTANNVVEIVSTISSDTTNAGNAWLANTAYVRPFHRLNSSETGLVVRTASVSITDITADLTTNARITDEATVRAGADSAAAGRLNTLETNYADPTKGNAALATKITDEATARTNADTALANRATALESTLNTPSTGVVARLSTEETTRANADTALSNRATALESTINTPNTGLSARMSTEETTRANADTALSNRATALETTLNTPTTGVVARLTTEETTRANADTALSNRATALESTVNTPTTGLSARMTTEETTRANADTALANRATTLESKSGSNGAINTNPTYTSYTNATGVPDGWTYDNQTNGGASRVAGEYGGYAVQLASAANTACYSASTANASIGVNSYWVIEADVKLNSGTFAGAGVLWRVNNGSTQADATIVFANDEDTTDTVVGAGTTGRVYRFRKLVQITLANVSSYTFYHMAHWGSMGSIAAANSITFYRCAVRPASNAEIKALKADAALNTPTTGVVARLTTEETTRSNADTALANRATALESSVNTPTTGLLARMSTEETTRSNADTALANRATALETTINTPTTGLSARMSTEETTRSNADTALANRATALETTINTPTTGLSARMSTEETTRSNADTALANRATSLETRTAQIPVSFTAVARGLGGANPSGREFGLYDGAYNRIWGGGGMWNVLTFNTSNQVDEGYTFNTLSSATDRANMRNFIASRPQGKTIVCFTFDEPQGNRFADGLEGVLYDIGAGQLYASSNFQYRGAYVLIGRKGIGKGGGIEAYAGSSSGSADAWVEQRFDLLGGVALLNNTGKGVVEAVARIAAEETTRANAVSAVTSRTSTLESSVGRFGYLNRNPTFVEPGWDNQYSYPPQWQAWSNDNGAYIGWSTGVASIYGAPHILQIDRNGMNSGLLNVSYGQFPRGYYVLEADVRLEDGATLGSGIHVNFNNGYADQINFNDEQDKAETVGNRANGNYSFSKLIFNGADSAQFNLYMMAGWSGFNGNVHRGFLRTIWQKAGVRIATASEIAAGKVQGIGARVTTAEGTLATINGKTQAYFSKSVSVPGAEAFITANAINDSGQATSNVAIGGNSIALYNTADGSARRAMYLAGGNATFDGFITARSGVRIGDGSWQIAVSPKDFNVSNGSNISYGYDLGRTPTITFGPCPVSLNAGEVYRAYAANSTSTGFTAVCEIVSAPTSSNQSVGPGSSSNGAQAYDVGKGTANATNNVYNFAVSGNVQAYAYNDGGGTNCVHIDAWLTDDLQAGDATVEDTIMVLTEDRETWEPARVERSYVAESHCVRITTASGIQLTLSEDTPITLRDGREIWVREVVGENVAVLDAGDFRWEEVVSLEEIGLQPVARLSVWSGTYAAGDVKGRMIFTHNLPNKP